jgi:chloramphenicol 3-O-phosphotransferase
MREPDIIFLNGASSSGKTTLGRALQRKLALRSTCFMSEYIAHSPSLNVESAHVGIEHSVKGARMWRMESTRGAPTTLK